MEFVEAPVGLTRCFLQDRILQLGNTNDDQSNGMIGLKHVFQCLDCAGDVTASAGPEDVVAFVDNQCRDAREDKTMARYVDSAPRRGVGSRERR